MKLNKWNKVGFVCTAQRGQERLTGGTGLFPHKAQSSLSASDVPAAAGEETDRSGAGRGSVTLHHPAWSPCAPPGSAVPDGVICSSHTGRTKYLCFRGMGLLPHESCQMDSPRFAPRQQQPQPTAAERARASTGPPLAKAVLSPLRGARRLGSSCGMRPSPRLPAELGIESVTWIFLVALPFSSP